MFEKLKITKAGVGKWYGYDPFIKICMSKYMMGSKPSCLEKWSDVDWMEKDFTARERRDLFKKIATCNHSVSSPKLDEDVGVTKHYIDLLEKRTGLSSKLLPQLYKNLSKAPIQQDEFSLAAEDVQRVIKENGLENQAQLSEYDRELNSKLKHFPLKYSLLSTDYFANYTMGCIRNFVERNHLFSNEEILDRTLISQQLHCILGIEIER
ncbi:predicted protein [Naegleria gruberi]|uniref:Predicted protein n=1 Tax=Naegleria gruberi TaxID=5762 RepID=D2VGN5_NAEGR|nr:uncharacterized protein NAEGRDRAFT_68041 [Naegleria gruberi]EFC43998.1 predicted protein [Naegleria gruberi]|eukprot:XP_002676742.1 predicted protein [Naegleria gruberi strain NEG-M]